MTLKRYHLGTTVWGLKEWQGVFFTKDVQPVQYLKQYASVFNSVEGNTTFYGTPNAETISKWNKQTPLEFKFCFKFPRLITHQKQLRDVEKETHSFLAIMEPLRAKLGPFLIQFPASFGPSQLDLLESYLELLSVDFRYAVEVRHPNFFNHGPHEQQLNNLLGSFGIDRVIFDTRKLHASKSREESIVNAQQKKPKVPVRFDAAGSHPFIRFVGVNDTLNNQPYLKEWAIIMAEWIKEGKHPYFFAHAPDRYYSIWIARKFHEILSELIEITPLPSWPADKENEQLDLF